MKRDEFRKRKFALRSVSTAPEGYWWENRLELADKEQLKQYIQVLLVDVKDLRAGLIGNVTDDEIRDMIKWKYGWIGTTNGEIARIIFEIACSIRNRVARPESVKIINLRERLDSAERRAKWAEEAAGREKQNDWRDRYNRLHKIHVEDVRRRKEVRRFRLANFSIEEMEREIARKKSIERKHKQIAAAKAQVQP